MAISHFAVIGQIIRDENSGFVQNTVYWTSEENFLISWKNLNEDGIPKINLNFEKSKIQTQSEMNIMKSKNGWYIYDNKYSLSNKNAIFILVPPMYFIPKLDTIQPKPLHIERSEKYVTLIWKFYLPKSDFAHITMQLVESSDTQFDNNYQDEIGSYEKQIRRDRIIKEYLAIAKIVLKHVGNF